MYMNDFYEWTIILHIISIESADHKISLYFNESYCVDIWHSDVFQQVPTELEITFEIMFGKR